MVYINAFGVCMAVRGFHTLTGGLSMSTRIYIVPLRCFRHKIACAVSRKIRVISYGQDGGGQNLLILHVKVVGLSMVNAHWFTYKLPSNGVIPDGNFDSLC